MRHANDAPPSPYVTGVTGRCPRCGGGKLFDGFLELAPRCEACGLDYGFADAGDGPAVIVTLLAGFIVVGTALVVEVKYEPPMWLHLAIFLPLTPIDMPRRSRRSSASPPTRFCASAQRPAKASRICSTPSSSAFRRRREIPMPPCKG
jgi:uncharacterized protein (DUF983 family)